MIASNTVLKQRAVSSQAYHKEVFDRVVNGEFTKLRANSGHRCSRIFLFDSRHYFALLLPFHCLQLLLQENGTKILQKNGIRNPNYRH